MTDLELTNAYDAYAKAIASGDQAAIMEALRRCQAAEARNALDDQLARLRIKWMQSIPGYNQVNHDEPTRSPSLQ